MAGYKDGFDNLGRLSKALRLNEPRITEIITLHVAVERELELALDALVKRPGHLRQLGHANRIKVFKSVCPFQENVVEPFVLLLQEFNKLRNAVAHGEPSNVLDRHIGTMSDLYKQLAPVGEKEPSVSLITAGIFGLLDGMVLSRLPKRPKKAAF